MKSFPFKQIIDQPLNFLLYQPKNSDGFAVM